MAPLLTTTNITPIFARHETLRPNSVRAWIVTGVYETGKSAFAHFLASLSGRSQQMKFSIFKANKHL